MYRYELKCKECGTTIGYMSSPYNPADDNPVINRVMCGDIEEPICCPVCEVRRLKENKDNIDLGSGQTGYEEGKNDRPKGEWIVTAEDNEGIHRIQCPFCRYEKGSDFIDYITVTFEKFPPFCENCGAELRGKEE